MKRFMMVFLVLSGFVMGAMAQDKVIYTCIVNKVPDGFNFPLIGFFNLADGSHTSGHIGLGNWNEENLNGVQIGLINLIGGETNGGQVGLINTSAERVMGLQLGLVNAAGEGVKGTQVGLVNGAEETDGAQLGLVNATETMNGAQIGLVNAAEELNGIRLGLVNAAEELNGVELGLVNVAENLNGFQLGLVNVVESADKGVPFGLISIVKEGGFRALEVSTSEMFPVNISYKIGIKPLYTTFMISYDPELPHYLASGIGIGSILPLSESLYFNPELMTHNIIVSDNSFLHTLALNVGYKLTDQLHLTAGPSIAWNHSSNTNELFKENFAIRKWALDDHNNLFVGVRIGIRYVFTDFD
jgi:hypothetical protein